MKLPLSALLLGVAIQFSAGCSATGTKVRDLPLEEKRFLSEVRYIITKKEKADFLTTPSTERQKFIEEFWKKRDPDPETEENEFRTEYYDRIAMANRLFREGSFGWESDPSQPGYRIDPAQVPTQHAGERLQDQVSP